MHCMKFIVLVVVDAVVVVVVVVLVVDSVKVPANHENKIQ